MVYFFCKVNFKTSLYPQTSTQEAELLNLGGNLVFCKGQFSRFTYTMIETLISAVTEETRRYLFNAYEPFNFDFVLKKTLVITTNLTDPESVPGLIQYF